MTTTTPPIVYDDGGAWTAGFHVHVGDCVVRAFAIATERPYDEVRRDVLTLAKLEKPRKGSRRSRPRSGVATPTIHLLAAAYGMTWTATMGIGTGTTVHVRSDELPATGRHVLRVTKHVCALIEGVIHDMQDPSRDGTRAVYGYWSVED